MQWDLKSASDAKSKALKRELWWLKLRELSTTCWLYAAIWLTPLVAGVLLTWLAPR